MEITRQYVGGDRYRYDFDECHPKHGWAQVDTGQDAPYFGTWANPLTLTIVNFIEGELVTTIASSPTEFADEIRRIKDWNIDQGHGFGGIDGMCDHSIIEGFQKIGLDDLMH